MKKEYKKLANYTGIYKHTKTGKYRAEKRIKGKYFSESFNRLSIAVQWRNTFDPFSQDSQSSLQRKGISFEELWMKYETYHFLSVEKSTQGIKRQKIEVLKPLLCKVKIYDITPEYLDHVIEKKKEEAKKNPLSKRFNFDKPLDELKATFNWYRENYDYKGSPNLMVCAPFLKEKISIES